MTPEEVEIFKEVSAMRKAIATVLQRVLILESTVDYFTAEEKQWRDDEKIRRRERCWKW